jgi:2-iminobutanoate/2-iminopropanoate deaminase
MNSRIKSVSSDKAPTAIGPYVQANIYENIIFTSGQIPLDPKTGEIVGTTIEEQAHQVFKNIGEVLTASDSSYDCVIKTTVFIKNMDDFVKLNTIYAKYFKGSELPARSVVEVARLPKDVLIEVETIAYRMINSSFG